MLPGGDGRSRRARLAGPVRRDRRWSASERRTRRIPMPAAPATSTWPKRLARDLRASGDPHGWNARFSRELNATDDRDAFGPRRAAGRSRASTSRRSSSRPGRRRASHRAIHRSPPAARQALRLRPRSAYRDVSGVAQSRRRSSPPSSRPAWSRRTRCSACGRRCHSERQHFLCACFNSYVLNTIVRSAHGQPRHDALVEDLPAPAVAGIGGRSAYRAARPRLSQSGASPRPAGRGAGCGGASLRPRRDAFERLLEGFPLVPRRASARLTPWRGEGVKPCDIVLGQWRTTGLRSICASASAATRARSPARPSTTFPSA